VLYCGGVLFVVAVRVVLWGLLFVAAVRIVLWGLLFIKTCQKLSTG